jgi:hypothetical protein
LKQVQTKAIFESKIGQLSFSGGTNQSIYLFPFPFRCLYGELYSERINLRTTAKINPKERVKNIARSAELLPDRTFGVPGRQKLLPDRAFCVLGRLKPLPDRAFHVPGRQKTLPDRVFRVP